MLDILFFIIPSLFFYQAYYSGKDNKNSQIDSQWILLTLLFIYSVVSLLIFRLLCWLWFDSSHMIFAMLTQDFFNQISLISTKWHSLKAKELFSYNNVSFEGYLFVCAIAFGLGKFVQKFKFLDFFEKLKSVTPTETFLEKVEAKIPVIFFMNSGAVHIGIIKNFGLWGKFECLEVFMICSGFKDKKGIVSYNTNYLQALEKDETDSILRIFYMSEISSIGELDTQSLIYFLNSKSEDQRTPTEKDMQKMFERES